MSVLWESWPQPSSASVQWWQVQESCPSILGCWVGIGKLAPPLFGQHSALLIDGFWCRCRWRKSYSHLGGWSLGIWQYSSEYINNTKLTCIFLFFVEGVVTVEGCRHKEIGRWMQSGWMMWDSEIINRKTCP